MTAAPAPRADAAARTRVALAVDLDTHGDRVAMIAGEETLTYAELAVRADRAAAGLGEGRRLVLVEVGHGVATLAAYLGALRAGHVVLLAAGADRAAVEGLTRAWDPDVVVAADGAVRERREASAHVLHTDLAVLMTTSGSTGSPRLVRLGATGIDANAAAVAASLGIEPDDRAVASLPLHYCYGLSIVHSNLARGAAVVLCDTSVTEPAFWDAVTRHRATSLHGVPHTFELLEHVERADPDRLALPHLRYVTQAGGRLPPEQVRRWVATGERAGWRFVVMYGQTEATARMAYLPPEHAETHPGAVGVAVPGGRLTIEPLDQDGVQEPPPDGVGEIVYRGPNVMLGYARTPADLALGRTVDALRTGDLGRIGPEGLVEVVGRRARFVKPFGVRIDLDGVERLLAEHGVPAAVTGDDRRLVVAALAPATATAVAELLDRLTLPRHVVGIHVVDALPRRPNGKIDHPAVAALGGGPDPDPGWSWSWSRPWSRRWSRPWSGAPRRELRAELARVLPGTPWRDDASFRDLGGDSLTYVRAGAGVERALGWLPPDWDRVPLGQLATMARDRDGRATVESVVGLRALAIVLVVGVHAGLWPLLGGAHLMLAMSGWMLARVALDPEVAGDVPRRLLTAAAAIAVPSALWIGFRALVQPDVAPGDALLLGSLLTPVAGGYWYVHVLVQALVALAALMAVPAVRALDRRRPLLLPTVVLALTLAARFWPPHDAAAALYATHRTLWLIALGWLLHRMAGRGARLAVLVPTAALVVGFFPDQPGRAAIVVVGLVVLVAVSRLRVPRPVAAVATALAAASLTIYLTHFALMPLAGAGVPAALVVVLALVAGWALSVGLTHGARLVARHRPR